MRSRIILGCLVVTGAICQACGPSIPDPGPMPVGGTFAGRWMSNWGKMMLFQEGDHVHGTYDESLLSTSKEYRRGSVSGDIKGDLWIFKWTQRSPRSYGRGYVRLSPDGKAFRGRWGYQTDYFNGGVWKATKQQ